MLQSTGRYGGAGLSQQQMFEASLITAVEPGARLLRCFEEGAEEEAAGAPAAPRRALRRAAPGGGPLGVAACYGPCPYPALEEFITSVCCEVGQVLLRYAWPLKRRGCRAQIPLRASAMGWWPGGAWAAAQQPRRSSLAALHQPQCNSLAAPWQQTRLAALCARICPPPLQGGAQGRVRSWAALDDDLMLFTMRDNRFCGNVGRQGGAWAARGCWPAGAGWHVWWAWMLGRCTGTLPPCRTIAVHQPACCCSAMPASILQTRARPHKSNGIYYVVDLRGGSWCQKCYDPECRHYRSPLAPLPPHLLGPAPPALPANAQALQQPAGQPCCARGGTQPGSWPSSAGGGGSVGGKQMEDEEESLMLQAVESYERSQAQQAQQPQAAPSGGGAAAAAAAAAPCALGSADVLAGDAAGDEDDELLLQALLQYEGQCGHRQHGARAAPAGPACVGAQQPADPAALQSMGGWCSPQVATVGPDAVAPACSTRALQGQPPTMQHPSGQQQGEQQDPAKLCTAAPAAPPLPVQQRYEAALSGLPTLQRCRPGLLCQRVTAALPGRQLGEVPPAAKRSLEVWEKLL